MMNRAAWQRRYRRSQRTFVRGDAFTLAEVALLLGVTPGAVRQWVLSYHLNIPSLPTVRRYGDTGQHFVERAALRQWLDATGRWTAAARKELGR